ncbi:SprT-like domain-containing protein (plasmid) [Haloferax sp. S1W]|uniref:SprT-like domain-containing protein n=1 Tax=Haloferax sp. S1W TaxID=3377110 RepID=UPI0037CCA66A
MGHDDHELADRFDSITTHDALIRWSRAYCSDAIETYGFDVALFPVEWEVSTRAKRRAAAVKTPQIDGASVGEPIAWETKSEPVDCVGDYPACTVSLSWRAFESFDRDEWEATLRHELVHIEQFQAYGTTDHGPAFKRRANSVDAPVRVRRFTTPKYVLLCDDCGDTVAHRYRDCKLVRNPDSYRSACCSAPLSSSKVPNEEN